MNKGDRYYMSSVKIGPKGQIVIPKEAREMFSLQPGDTLVLLADKKKGIAIQTAEKLNPMLRKVFAALPDGEDEEAEDE
jgi:AbrB family looped-hinge helix DNA binding protein